MASQHAKGVIFRNTINTLPMMSARTSLPGLKHHRFQGPNSTSLRHTRTYKISTGPLDGWGYTLFDCDYDLDLVDSINQEASHLGCEDLDLMYPKDEKDKKNVVKQLDTNLFRLLLQRFLVKGFTERAVYLGALAMRLGVKIRDTEMQVLRESVGRVKMYDEAREQMRAALKGYNPEGGCPWDFSYLGPTETQWQGGEEEDDLDFQANTFKEELSKMTMSILKEWEGKTHANDTVQEQSAKTLLRKMRWAIRRS